MSKPTSPTYDVKFDSFATSEPAYRTPEGHRVTLQHDAQVILNLLGLLSLVAKANKSRQSHQQER
ncbi:hypothetical protein [Pseudorhodobacter turbinis]|uniref:hypothetical protein n=1 Tax=Pseudorhodobacter turbinis TaxID=2500533 RepID=UPI00143D22A3|nr:hypothetical protein [Pseudorhodobacter turbinis]